MTLLAREGSTGGSYGLSCVPGCNADLLADTTGHPSAFFSSKLLPIKDGNCLRTETTFCWRAHTMELFCAWHGTKMANSRGSSRQRWANKFTGERHKLPAKDNLQQASCSHTRNRDSFSAPCLSDIQVILPYYPKKSHQLHFLSSPAVSCPSLVPDMLRISQACEQFFGFFSLSQKNLNNCERKKRIQ